MTPTKPPTAPAPTAAELLDQLALAAAAYYRNFAVTAAGQELTLMQGKMLSVLRRPMSMRALAELLGCDASNITGIVDRLETRGLVRRTADPADRRIKNVVLTDEGAEAVRRIRAEMMQGLTGLEQLDEEERRVFRELLGRVLPGAAA